MPRRYEHSAVTAAAALRPASALRFAFRHGYRMADLRADLLAGLVVGVIALPLSMALAIASGVPPQHGIYTAIVAGALAPLLGGSTAQVTGPTAAFVVILSPIAAKFGVAGLLLASCIAGALLILMAVARFGRLIEYIPYPVTTGFTAGIAVVIATLQLKDFLGLSIAHMPEHYLGRVGALAAALGTMHWPDVLTGALTLAVLVVLPRWTRRVPSPLVALPVGALAAALLGWLVPGFEVATILTRFPETRGVPQLPPLPMLPWLAAGPGGEPLDLSFDVIESLAMAAFAIAMLGAIESLLSAVVADGMVGSRHDPDAELLAQGVGNLVGPFFGGFAATGAIARTATNIRCGARSPIAAIIHALFILVAVLAFAPVLGHLPMASLAALLLIVAWNMSEVRHFAHTLRVAPRSDVAVLITCFGLTVVFDMVIAVTAGVVLAALLFIRRMSDLSGTELLHEGHPELPEPLPRGILLYRIAGPLFFGAAQKAMSALRTVSDDVRVVILDMTEVPVMDATGLVNFESVLNRLHASRVFVVVAGIRPQPRALTRKAGWDRREWLVVLGSLDEAIVLARSLSGSDFPGGAPLDGGTTPAAH